MEMKDAELADQSVGQHNQLQDLHQTLENLHEELNSKHDEVSDSLRRERELDQNPVDGRVRIELVHERQQLGLRSVGRKGDLTGVEAELAGIPILHAHVDLARGILAHEHRRETRDDSPFGA